jgi:2-polyprenyl-3-methyl-5-hydroxy-6-metoxy-1,4-benzoquinol methylase
MNNTNGTFTQVEQLRASYDQDTEYFEQLSAWHNSGLFARRVEPLLRFLRPYLYPETAVLDAGCAAGAMAIEIAKAGVRRVEAVDFSATAIKMAHQNAVHHQVIDQIRFFESKLESMTSICDDTYDLIVAADVIEHIVAPDSFIREMWRVCRPGGIILIETPNTLFRHHHWYPRIASLCSFLHLPQSQNLFSVSSNHNWGNYHVSLLSWPELIVLLRAEKWDIVREVSFGWWLRLGAADKIMSLIGRIDSVATAKFRYYGNTDVVIIAQKPKEAVFTAAPPLQSH